MRKHINRKLMVLLLIGLTLSACPLITFLSDRDSYRFTGTISGSLDHKRIASVKVIASCEKSRLDPPVETLSDDNGTFILRGYGWGALDDCQLRFEHPRFKPKVVKLKPARELTEDTGFIKIWRVTVELEPL
jgi:hypothetical protein